MQQELDLILKKYGTADRVARRAKEQMQRAYKQRNLPNPLIALFQHWSDAPYYAGWHSWNIGTKAWSYAEELVQPFENFDVFTCGEAFSSEQGWIEGALKFAERVLERLGLSGPEWLTGQEHKEYQDQKTLLL